MAGSYGNLNLLNTPFQEIVTSEKNTVLSVLPQYGISQLRDTTTIVGSATAAESNGEILLTTAAATNNSVALETVARGVYAPGHAAEWGIGIRRSSWASTATGQEAQWGGISDANNGLLYGIDSTSMYVRLLYNGTPTTIRRTSWNIDKLDGTGSSRIDLANYANAGIIWQCLYTWYGYGGILFQALIPSSTFGRDRVIPLHYIQPSAGQVSILDPNVSLRCSVSNTTSTASHVIAVGGRQYSIYGKTDSNLRLTPELRSSASTNQGQRRLLIAARKLATFRSRTNTVAVAPYSMQVNSSNRTHEVALFLEPRGTATLTWGTPTNVPTSETAIETAIDGGINYIPSVNAYCIYRGVVQTATTLDVTDFRPIDVHDFALPQDRELYLTALAIGGNGTIDACALNMKELW
jgi:hypothetical protein